MWRIKNALLILAQKSYRKAWVIPTHPKLPANKSVTNTSTNDGFGKIPFLITHRCHPWPEYESLKRDLKLTVEAQKLLLQPISKTIILTIKKLTRCCSIRSSYHQTVNSHYQEVTHHFKCNVRCTNSKLWKKKSLWIFSDTLRFQVKFLLLNKNEPWCIRILTSIFQCDKNISSSFIPSWIGNAKKKLIKTKLYLTSFNLKSK